MNSARTLGTTAALGFAVAIASTTLLAAAGFSASAFLPVAWILAISVAALHAGLREGIVWLEHPAVSRIVTFTNVAFIVALMFLGPASFADADAVQRGRPAVLGVTGYRIGLDRQGKVGVDIGPEPSKTPRAPYLSVPGIPRQSEGTHPVNLPVHLDLVCQGSDCSLRATPTGVRRDFTVGVRRSAADDWQMAGAIDVRSGHTLRLRERSALGSTSGDEVILGEEPHRERRIPIRIDDDAVSFGDCSIPFNADPARPLYIPVLELRFLTTENGCHLLPIAQADILRGRWLKRAPDGSIDIPAHSFFELRGGQVRWFPLESHNLDAALIDGDGSDVEPTTAVQIDFGSDEAIQLAVFRRRFAEILLGESRRDDCVESWQAREQRFFGRASGTACRRLTGSLRSLKLSATIEKQGPQRLLAVKIDRDDVNWGHRLFLDIPQGSWETERLGQRRRAPRRHVLLTGRWPDGASVVGSGSEEVLAVPFRLHGTTPYRAVLTLERSDDDSVVLRVADATRRGEVAESRAALNLGPPESQAILFYERPSSPHALARAVLWPCLCLAGLLAAIAGFGTRLGPVVMRCASVTSTLALVIAYTLLQKSLIAYSVTIHPPHDWEAFDQLVASALIMPLALASGAMLALVSEDVWRPRVRSQHPWVFVVLIVVIAGLRGIGTLLGWESVGDLRFVVTTPLLAALVWMAMTAAARTASDNPDRSQSLLDGALIAAAGALVLSWWGDKGAMLMLAVPVALALIYHAWRLAHGTALIVMIALGFAAVFLVPREVVRLWSIQDAMELPALAVDGGSTCSEITPASDIRQSVAESCQTPVATHAEVLTTLDQIGLLDTTASISSRRHPLRRLDWLEDGARASDCDAIDRFPTRDAMEVGFFRALVDRYRSEPESVYLREQLLPFSPGVTDALLNDYAGLVTYLPQMPKGSFSGVAIMLLSILLLATGHGRPWQTWAGASALGAAALLAGAGVLTIAANLDVFPNFAQSIPLLALRSHSAVLLDALAVALIGFGLVRHRSGPDRQREEPDGT